jgi:hypothetical protein
MEISNGSKKRCRQKFDYKGIGRVINDVTRLLEDFWGNDIIGEFIYQHDDALHYNVLLYLIRENCKDEKILNELNKFKYMTNENKIKKSIAWNK